MDRKIDNSEGPYAKKGLIPGEIKFRTAQDIVRWKYACYENPDVLTFKPIAGESPMISLAKNHELFKRNTRFIWVVSPGASASSFVLDKISEHENRYGLKSHSLPTKYAGKPAIKHSVSGGNMWEVAENDKVLYIYSHPMDILLSFHRKINQNYDSWEKGNPHYAQFLECDVSLDFNKNYLYKDLLKLEQHLDRWWRPNQMNSLCIKYEKLFENEALINQFLEVPESEYISFGEFTPRITNWENSNNKEQLKKTYKNLINKYENKPDYEIFRSWE
tara:strand:+ start:248 stop:1072 length:825 start_codon:yes stop_codon:yes gene_type:complete